VGNILIDAEKIGQAVDEGEGEDKPEGAPFDADDGQDRREEEKRHEDELKRRDEGNVDIIKAAEKDQTDGGQDEARGTAASVWPPLRKIPEVQVRDSPQQASREPLDRNQHTDGRSRGMNSNAVTMYPRRQPLDDIEDPHRPTMIWPELPVVRTPLGSLDAIIAHVVHPAAESNTTPARAEKTLLGAHQAVS
jgi:hypothetical protein